MNIFICSCTFFFLHIYTYRNSARFLRKRMLINQKNNGWIISDEANKIWEVCKALWNNDYQQAYGLLNNNDNNSSQQQQQERWASVELQTMIVDILASIRERVLNKIVTAYTTISLADVVYYFGLPENDLIQGKLYIFISKSN